MDGGPLMCGIVGIRALARGVVDRDALDAATHALHHRGPDDRRLWLNDEVGFGHTRLSIIDLGGSQQPMHTVDGRQHLIFNGEILNYRSVRAGLSDHAFQTDGDTETLFASVLRHGPAGLAELRGQFAFALYDEDDGSVLLARDRMGVLPLYYAVRPDRVVFGSEVKALLPLLDQRPSVNDAALDDFLAQRAVGAPHTLFDGVRAVRPGHALRIHADGRLEESPYWTLPVAAPIEISPQDAVTAVSDALIASTEEALVADVPVGAYLSGGVDSSLTVALVAKVTGEPSRVKTFSAGFVDNPHDELPHARTVAEHVGTDHREVMIDPAGFLDAWPTLTWHRDAPLSEPADIAVFQLAKAAREDVKVVLSGEGSDELFAGYPKYGVSAWVERLRRVPAPMRGPLLRRLERALPGSQAKLRIAVRTLAASTEREVYRSWFAPFVEHERAALLGRSIEPRPAVDGVDAIDKMLRADLECWLPNNLLERGDRMSMAASLELRPPFLDARLVELAFSLPSDVKVRDGVTKWVLKEVARRHLPTEIVDRRKVGFRVPLDRWFRSGLQEHARERLLDRESFVAQRLDRPMVEALLTSHESGRRDEELRIWTLMCLDVWHEVFFRA
ncbi:MAG: asparagine synthase (glutamine-hydrolyzing) [Actinomycetota bacterium]